MSHPIAVLDDKYYRTIQLVDVFVSNINDKKKTAKLVQFLNQDFPLPDLLHLKRVRSTQNKDAALQIVVCNYGDDMNKIQSVLSSNDVYKCLGKLYKVQVPGNQPLTREQFEESKLYWPVNFHEDKRIGILIKGQLFSNEEIESINGHMQAAVDMAKMSKAGKEMCVGAVIVDPNNNQIKAKSYDCRHGDHPLHHAVMLCVDLVAKSQGGGMWQTSEEMFYDASEVQDSVKNVPHERIPSSQEACDTSADSKSHLLHGQQTQSNKITVAMDTAKHHGTTYNYTEQNLRVVAESSTEPNRKQKTGPYLCTGYDLYVTKEPCVMCAMALVHARIKTVFYGNADEKEGALGSKFKVHTQTGLNHHYEVFKGVLVTECGKLLKQDVT